MITWITLWKTGIKPEGTQSDRQTEGKQMRADKVSTQWLVWWQIWLLFNQILRLYAKVSRHQSDNPTARPTCASFWLDPGNSRAQPRHRRAARPSRKSPPPRRVLFIKCRPEFYRGSCAAAAEVVLPPPLKKCVWVEQQAEFTFPRKLFF